MLVPRYITRSLIHPKEQMEEGGREGGNSLSLSDRGEEPPLSHLLDGLSSAAARPRWDVVLFQRVSSQLRLLPPGLSSSCLRSGGVSPSSRHQRDKVQEGTVDVSRRWPGGRGRAFTSPEVDSRSWVGAMLLLLCSLAAWTLHLLRGRRPGRAQVSRSSGSTSSQPTFGPLLTGAGVRPVVLLCAELGCFLECDGHVTCYAAVA